MLLFVLLDLVVHLLPTFLTPFKDLAFLTLKLSGKYNIIVVKGKRW